MSDMAQKSGNKVLFTKKGEETEDSIQVEMVQEPMKQDTVKFPWKMKWPMKTKFQNFKIYCLTIIIIICVNITIDQCLPNCTRINAETNIAL